MMMIMMLMPLLARHLYPNEIFGWCVTNISAMREKKPFKYTYKLLKKNVSEWKITFEHSSETCFITIYASTLLSALSRLVHVD